MTQYSIEHTPGDEVIRVSRVSYLSGKMNAMDLPMTIDEFDHALIQWQDGMLVQDAFPTLSAEQREFLMTGATREEWDARFGDDDERELGKQSDEED